MASKKNATPDVTRTLTLLWGSQTQAGRSGLTLKAIIAAAIELADIHGLEALSMRNVGERLNVGAMSLYTHVPGKDELVDLMMDTAYGQLYDSVEKPSQQGSWQEALRFIAQENWMLYLRHPWMLELTNGRPALGPHATLKYEAELRPLDKLGLTDVEMDASLTLLLTHVMGCARSQALMDRTVSESGMTDGEWWVIQEPLLNKLVDQKMFPVATRVGEASSREYQGASSPEHALTFGVERIIAGIADLIRTKTNE